MIFGNGASGLYERSQSIYSIHSVMHELVKSRNASAKATTNANATSTALKRAEIRKREQSNKYTKTIDRLTRKLADMAKELEKNRGLSSLYLICCLSGGV